MTSGPGSLRSLVAASALGLVLLAGGAARAQAAGGDKIAAESLFEQARTLMTDGKFADACPKFADSQRLDPSAGTLLNLASCYEKLGRTATAWATYREAASAANAVNRTDYVTAAQRHAEGLAPKLAKLTATVTQPVDGLQVRRDGVDVAKSAWGVPIPIDKGSHAIEASAPGYKTWSATVDVPQDGAQVSVSVPALDAAPAAPPTPAAIVAPPAAPAPAPAAPPPDASTGSTQRILGLVIGGVGVVGLGIGGAFALMAKGKYNDSLGNCQTANPNLCNGTGVDTRNQALDDGAVATVAVAVGVAALVGGAVIWFTAPSAPSSATTGRLVIAPTLGGAVVQGAW